MTSELQKLADKFIEHVEKERGTMTAFDKERIYYFVEIVALQGVIDYQNKQIGETG